MGPRIPRQIAPGFVHRQQIAVFVEVSDYGMAREADVFVQSSQTELPFQVIGQCLGLRQEVLE